MINSAHMLDKIILLARRKIGGGSRTRRREICLLFNIFTLLVRGQRLIDGRVLMREISKIIDLKSKEIDECDIKSQLVGQIACPGWFN